MVDEEMHRQIKLATLKGILAYQIGVRKDRRQHFEEWDKTSEALINQYQKEIEVLAGKEQREEDREV